jgi:hypothetical protein
LGIQPGRTGLGAPVSEGVAASVEALAVLLGALLAKVVPAAADLSGEREGCRC